MSNRIHYTSASVVHSQSSGNAIIVQSMTHTVAIFSHFSTLPATSFESNSAIIDISRASSKSVMHARADDDLNSVHDQLQAVYACMHSRDSGAECQMHWNPAVVLHTAASPVSAAET